MPNHGMILGKEQIIEESASLEVKDLCLRNSHT